MFTTQSLSGNGLPPKTLCFTFDDGPGANTLDIAKYLYEEGIPATFFVVGKYAVHHRETLDTLIKWNHTVGNHTYDHPDLPYYVSVNGDIQDQVLRTETVLPYSKNDTIYFRAPYGKWSQEVAAELNSNLLSALNYVGPIHWDVGGVDCWYWRQGKSVEEALETYTADIEKAGKGIVVFHDEIADMDFLKPANQTFELIKQLVPRLKAMGYSFVSLESIEAIKEAAKSNLLFELSVAKGKMLCLSSAGNIVLSESGSAFAKSELAFSMEKTGSAFGKPELAFSNSGTAFSKSELDFSMQKTKSAFSMQKIGNGKVLLLIDQHYLSLSDEELVTITQDKIAAAPFDYIPVKNNCFMLRCISGNYLAIDQMKRVSATAPFMRSAAIFNYKPINVEANTDISLKERLLLIKKGFLFIKSKVFS